MRTNTICVQGGYEPENGQPRVLPIYQSTTYKYDSSEFLGQLFDLTAPGHMYSRISNPTLECVEKKIADLEGGVGAMLTSSGQSASMIAILNILGAGDHFIASSEIYGGTVNLLAVTLKKLGVDMTFVRPDISVEDLQKEFKENTKLVFGETLTNPSLSVLDIEKFAAAAHQNGVPLIVDNTFPTPINCRPLSFGADIVVHSTTKYMDGHACVVGGVIVDGGKFNWEGGKFPGLTQPDESYHGVVYTKQFGNLAYITKARVQLMRDMGCTMSAQSAFLLNLGLETLHLRVARHCENALAVAKFLTQHEKVATVNFPHLEGAKGHELAMKYMPKGGCGVISFELCGGKAAAVKFMDSLKLAAIVVHVADARTCVLHPASTTHRQLTDQQLADCGVSGGLIRMSVGIEDIDDILDDIRQALAAI